MIENLENEIWKDVAVYEGRYKISNHGRLISINGKWKGERLMNPCIDSTGYYKTSLRNNGKDTHLRIHKIVALNFLDNTNNLDCINHIDGNKLNNHMSNLEWISRADNIRHANEIGLINANGEKSSNSKLKESQVLLIREWAKEGLSHQQISNKLNNIVNRRHITDIINRVNWKHI